MPGRQATRERHERVVLRARELGVEAAAAESGVTIATVKKWMQQSPLAAPEVVPVSVPDPEPEPDDPVERLEHRAKRARELAALGETQAKALLEAGKASEARNASATASYSHAAALELERAIGEERERHVRMAELHARVFAEQIRRLIAALGLSSADGLGPLVRWWMETLGHVSVDGGEVCSPEPPEDLCAAARRGVRKLFEPEIRAEVRAECEAEAARMAPRASVEPVEATGEVIPTQEPPETAERLTRQAENVDPRELADRVTKMLEPEPGFAQGASRWLF